VFNFESLTESYSRLELSKKTVEMKKEPLIIESKKKLYQSTLLSKAFPITISAIVLPVVAYADTFANVFAQFLIITDWLAAGIIGAAGISWMFGHRSKGIELMICVAVGYTISRNALNIRDWLKSIQG